MRCTVQLATLLFLIGAHVTLGNNCFADEIKLVSMKFTGAAKPKNVVKGNSYTNHFSVSASYKTEVEVEAQVPDNTAFNVRMYAIVGGQRVPLGDARVGRARGNGHGLFVAFHVFPSSANFYGQCQFVLVVDADNEITETDESPASNEWRFQATVHRPGESF